MALTDLLTSTIDVHDGEALDARRRPTASTVTKATGVAAAVIHRAARSIVYDDSGAPIADLSILTIGSIPIAEGDTVTVTRGPRAGQTLVCTGPEVPKVQRRTGTVHHYTTPARRLT